MPFARSLIVALGLLAATPVLAAPDPVAPLSARAQKALAGRTAGRPVSCVQLRQLQSTVIIDGTAVIYKQSARLWYVNQPDGGRCSLLRPDRALITRTSSGQLCRGDLVTIIEPSSPIEYGACGLSEFVPYTK